MESEARLVKHRGKWAVRVNGKRYSTGETATDECRNVAERAARQIVARLTAPTARDLGSIIKAYAADKKTQGKDDRRTLDSWSALKKHFDGLTANDISREICRRYAEDRRASGISDGTILRDLKILKAACSWHDSKHGGVFWYPQEPEPRDRHLSKEEVVNLIECAEAAHVKLFLELAYATAARAGALYDLTWLQVNLEDGGHIYLGRKANGKKRATVPLTKRLHAALEAAAKVRESSHVLEYAGKPIKSVRTGFEAACRRAGIKSFRIHDMRHTAAVHMAGGGVPMEKIQQYLGHSNIGTTIRIYARYQPEHLRDAADALEL